MRVGLVGGLGPESTIDYYRRILTAWDQLDPATAPSIVIDSLDVRELLRLVATDIPALTKVLRASLIRLGAAGVDFIAITANTPHIVFDDLVPRSPVPLISIVETCANEARNRELYRMLLLGTRFTMEAPFYKDVFARHGMAVVIPSYEDRTWVHERYVEELLKGQFRDETRNEFVEFISRMRDEESIDGVILGGTELPLLLSASNVAGLPLLDTTDLHVQAIVKRLYGAGAT